MDRKTVGETGISEAEPLRITGKLKIHQGLSLLTKRLAGEIYIDVYRNPNGCKRIRSLAERNCYDMVCEASPNVDWKQNSQDVP